MPTLVVDLHFGALLGAGWTSNDVVNTILTAYATTDVPAGSFDIHVTTVSGFYPGMLLTYQGVDGEYYPFRLNSISGSTLRASRKLPVAIASGGPVHNVYKDDAHPNDKGGAMVADAALRQLSAGRTREVEKILRESAAWSASGGASVSTSPVVSYDYPGSDSVGYRAMTVSGTAVNGGVNGTFTSLQGGDYVAKVTLNTGNRTGGYNNAVQVFVDEKLSDGTINRIYSSDSYVGYDATHVIEAPFYAYSNRQYRVSVTCPNSGPWSFLVGQAEYFRVVGDAINLNVGKHVLFGDSWFLSGRPVPNRLTERLPNATIVAKGVGGNKASQLIERFNADVVPENPNFVWVIVGTNDYYAGVTPADFEAQIGQLRQMILGIGAIPIFFTPSVGAMTFSPSQLYPSRRYVTYVRFWTYADQIPDTSASPWRSSQISKLNLEVPGWSSVTAHVAGKTKQSAVLDLLACDNPSVKVVAGFSLLPNGGNPVECSEFSTVTEKRKMWIRRACADSRFLTLQVKNPSSEPAFVSLVADVSWNPD